MLGIRVVGVWRVRITQPAHDNDQRRVRQVSALERVLVEKTYQLAAYTQTTLGCLN
jgi:hypothetical protein